MDKRGWKVEIPEIKTKLPSGWTLRETVDYLHLVDSQGRVAAVWYKNAEVRQIKSDIKEILERRR